MTLQELLSQRQPAVCERWLDAILRDYGPVTAARWRKEQDPFANPVGHALSTGLPELLDAIALRALGRSLEAKVCAAFAEELGFRPGRPRARPRERADAAVPTTVQGERHVSAESE